ncbi:MAG: hypothetical protein EWM72_03167 [Nitrospira sp.]|nr:MAG: hypothetical protein EWM72_03167 [Nitrospira sp.]
MDSRPDPRWKHTRKIFSDASASNMRDPFDGEFLNQGENLFGVDPSRREEHFPDRTIQFRYPIGYSEFRLIEQNSSCQRVPVAMES